MTGATAARPSELRVEALAKRFGGLNVFQDLSFRLAPGDILGVIGPNGAGKTTLINVVCGQLPPSAGRIHLGEIDITGKAPHTVSAMGIVRSFQQTNIFRSASVRENISRAIRFSRGGEERWPKVETLLREFELLPRLDAQGDKLPYGLQKMLGLVMAYATGPKVLLLDEPAAGLERSERARIDQFVEHARAHDGCSVLVVEHDMELIRRLCPRILVLNAGTVLAEGPPAEVMARADVIEAYLGVEDDEEKAPPRC
jgi:branched-chain amino acid transport system ATP-binding protein/branched-chain amino acid transport system permease protein